ncbi:MAG TPA: nucleoside-diphosphate sugar epimerase [Methanophagales archaeon]|nr:nucleoside-diphosphate sugar epimerase [Methanophagales archaeon]
MEKILITGSSGTIGTRLCERLLEKGYDIIGVDREKNKWLKEIDKRTINVDLREKETVLKKLPGDVDIVIHLAANARVFNLVIDPSQARDNFEILFNILEYTRKNKIKKFVFSSSREVYGNSNKVIHSEEEAYVKNCESPYTASKIGGEALVHAYNQCYGINFVILRFSNVYGMYDSSDRVIPLFLEKVKKGEELTVFGEDKLLDFIYIDDVVDGIILTIQKFEKVKNSVFNIAYGGGTSILEVAKLIKEQLKADVNVSVKENRTGEVVKSVADIARAKEKLGYSPKTTITEGIIKSIKWYGDNQK